MPFGTSISLTTFRYGFSVIATVRKRNAFCVPCPPYTHSVYFVAGCRMLSCGSDNRRRRNWSHWSQTGHSAEVLENTRKNSVCDHCDHCDRRESICMSFLDIPNQGMPANLQGEVGCIIAGDRPLIVASEGRTVTRSRGHRTAVRGAF